MADVRSLLKAKRQEARISHPYATYTSSDQLKCSICTVIIKHASAWEGHLGSKAHRTNVARARQEELAAAQRERELLEEGAARKREQAQNLPVKRKAEETIAPSPDREAGKQKKAKLTAPPSGFPADFFSDLNRQIPTLGDNDGEDEEEDNAMAVDSTTPAAGPSKSAVDEEYEAFQRAMLASQAEHDPAETFAQATIAAEPEIYTEEQISGFHAPGAQPEDNAPPMTEGETEETKRKAKELEERELIMDRLLEEERIQEEADMRVAAMKNRLEALKRKREARKAGKSQTAKS